jgi:hypothetical protein
MNSLKTNETIKKRATELNWTFTKEEVQMTKKHMAVKEMQIKTTLRFHLTPVRMTTIKNTTTNNKCWWGCREKGTLIHCWWECKLVQPLWKTIWRLFKILNLDLPYDPAIPLLRLRLLQRHLQAHVYCSTIYNSPAMETVKMPHYQRMD